MPVRIARGASDAVLDQIVAALQDYGSAHAGAEIDVYRHSGVSIRIRVVDPDLAGMTRGQRHGLIWQALAGVSDEAQSDISSILMITPDEAASSVANFEFDHPVPTVLA